VELFSTLERDLSYTCQNLLHKPWWNHVICELEKRLFSLSGSENRQRNGAQEDTSVPPKDCPNR